MDTHADLIDALADAKRRYRAIVDLVGAINANDLRRVTVTPEAKAALIAGLAHPNAKVRWWCLQLMDHLADESYQGRSSRSSPIRLRRFAGTRSTRSAAEPASLGASRSRCGSSPSCARSASPTPTRESARRPSRASSGSKDSRHRTAGEAEPGRDH